MKTAVSSSLTEQPNIQNNAEPRFRTMNPEAGLSIFLEINQRSART